MGEVYRADDTRLGQTVALKFLPDTVARDRATLERFYAEVRIGRQVSHPNVCRLYDLVELDGHHCLSMEFIDGEDLASLLKRIGRLPVDKAIDISREICAGLAAAHDKGVIHRDLKPANIMVDGQGRACITDFGLATVVEEAAGSGFAGTPAYMAPEQFEGAPASTRSDLFSLGAVLYEVFTGKRLFDGRTLAEIKSAHENSRPPSLSSSVRDVPPALERVVSQCLQKQPSERPPSAYAIIAALPGGDPLQAALAAGETPSPAMVAAAGKVGDLSATRAWLLLASALGGLLLVAWLATGTTLIGTLRPDKSPEVLGERADALVERLGYAAPGGDRAAWFDFDLNYLRYAGDIAARHGPLPRIGEVRPSPLLFVQRRSPRYLAATRLPELMVLPSEIGRIGRNEPPMDVPGMTRVILDGRGRLVEFLAVPPARVAPDAAPGGGFDWSPLLAEAGFDAALTQAAPEWTAPVDTDQKFAWSGNYAGQPGVAMRIEAASFRGRPVWFSVLGPWSQPRGRPPPVFLQRVAWIVLGFSVLTLAGILVMLRRNLRLARGDRRGALVLARVVFATLAVALLVRADHAASVLAEMRLTMAIASEALTFALAAWALYLAFEPHARKRWPDLLISWSRLLDGRLRDPMVGRDVVIGALGGIAMALVLHLDVLVPSLPGHQQHLPLAQVASSLGSARHLLYFLLVNVYTAMGLGLASLVAMLVLQAITRSRWLAIAAQFAAACIYFLAAFPSNPPFSSALLLVALIWLAMLVRMGLLASAASYFFLIALQAIPLTLDPRAWYFGTCMLGMGVLAGLLLYGFHVSLAGKPLLPHAWLDGEAGR
jgi:serine/threonine-protein kinase